MSRAYIGRGARGAFLDQDGGVNQIFWRAFVSLPRCLAVAGRPPFVRELLGPFVCLSGWTSALDELVFFLFWCWVCPEIWEWKLEVFVCSWFWEFSALFGRLGDSTETTPVLSTVLYCYQAERRGRVRHSENWVGTLGIVAAASPRHHFVCYRDAGATPTSKRVPIVGASAKSPPADARFLNLKRMHFCRAKAPPSGVVQHYK